LRDGLIGDHRDQIYLAVLVEVCEGNGEDRLPNKQSYRRDVAKRIARTVVEVDRDTRRIGARRARDGVSQNEVGLPIAVDVGNPDILTVPHVGADLDRGIGAARERSTVR
jgi:hypothetical protein